GKKKRAMPQAAPGGLPTDQVMMMRQQNYTDDQIVQNLQSQGYNSSQIFDAINQVNIGGQMQGQMGQDMPEQMQQPYGMEQQMPYGPEPEQMQMPEQPEAISERIEELTEAIIDEKWKEFTADINRVIEWKDKTESRITRLEQQIIDIKTSIDSLYKSLLSKIGQYDQNITDVGTEMKAMEKVFQKVLPTLTENVNKLERLSNKAPPKR
ncbi:MAG: hypothetical protein AABX65_02315, partial [Nanoarchaeota archaeon]